MSDTARIVPAAQYRRTPWKNGGGETREISIAPAGASLSDFDWRMSLATVASDGPFSEFPGVDRTLCIVDGAGVRLQIDGNPAVTLTPTSAPWEFAGERRVLSALIDGVVTDFNVMTRRAAFRHDVTRRSVDRGGVLNLEPTATALFCARGAVTAYSTAAEPIVLGLHDTLFLGQPAHWTVAGLDRAELLIITIRPAGRA
mgnify:CR=1 FL=1